MSTETNPWSDGGGHALVIGGSMAGLLAARVLSERFGRAWGPCHFTGPQNGF